MTTASIFMSGCVRWVAWSQSEGWFIIFIYFYFFFVVENYSFVIFFFGFFFFFGGVIVRVCCFGFFFVFFLWFLSVCVFFFWNFFFFLAAPISPWLKGHGHPFCWCLAHNTLHPTFLLMLPYATLAVSVHSPTAKTIGQGRVHGSRWVVALKGELPRERKKRKEK